VSLRAGTSQTCSSFGRDSVTAKREFESSLIGAPLGFIGQPTSNGDVRHGSGAGPEMGWHAHRNREKGGKGVPGRARRTAIDGGRVRGNSFETPWWDGNPMRVEDHPGPATGGTSRPRYGIEQSICKHRGVVSESLVGVRLWPKSVCHGLIAKYSQ